MCGILALFSAHKKIHECDLDKGLEVMQHRGPDNKGMWLSPDASVGLGHMRLSIMDPAAGDQPIANAAGTLHIAVNGEFYDFENLRADLKRRGHVFKTASDSEIALHLYDEYGVAALDYLRGEFAFCLWDEANRTLFAARDRFGIKPLYYTVYRDTLFLGSEIKSLFAAGVQGGVGTFASWIVIVVESIEADDRLVGF